MSLENGFTSDNIQNEEEKAKMLEESISRIQDELALTTDEEKRKGLEESLEELRNK